jgi:hypothetical protein
VVARHLERIERRRKRGWTRPVDFGEVVSGWLPKSCEGAFKVFEQETCVRLESGAAAQ